MENVSLEGLLETGWRVGILCFVVWMCGVLGWRLRLGLRVASLKSLCEWVAVNGGKICGGQDLQGRGKFLSVTSALSEGWAFVSVSWTSVMMWAQNKKEHGSWGGIWDWGQVRERVGHYSVSRRWLTVMFTIMKNIYVFILFFHFFLNFILFIFLYSRFLLVICFIHISVYMSIPISQFIPPSPSPLCPHIRSLCLRLYSCLANRKYMTLI